MEYFNRSKNLYYEFFENICEISKKYNFKVIIKLKKKISGQIKNTWII